MAWSRACKISTENKRPPHLRHHLLPRSLRAAGRQLLLSNPKSPYLVVSPGIFHALHTLPGMITHTFKCLLSCIKRSGALRVGTLCRRARYNDEMSSRPTTSLLFEPRPKTVFATRPGSQTLENRLPPHQQDQSTRKPMPFGLVVRVAAFACLSQSPWLVQHPFLAPA